MMGRCLWLHSHYYRQKSERQRQCTAGQRYCLQGTQRTTYFLQLGPTSRTLQNIPKQHYHLGTKSLIGELFGKDTSNPNSEQKYERNACGMNTCDELAHVGGRKRQSLLPQLQYYCVLGPQVLQSFVRKRGCNLCSYPLGAPRLSMGYYIQMDCV